MSDIPTVTFQILGPNEGVAEGSHKGLWFKVHSNPPPASNLLVGLKVCASKGYVIETGYEFLEYSVGDLSKIVPYQWKGPDRGLWTDEKR